MNKEKPLFVIPVETKVRELEAKLLLGLIALGKGMDVVIGGLNEMKYLVDVLDKGVYLDKSIVKPKEKWFRKCIDNGYKVVALDEEGLVSFDAETYRQLRIFPESMRLVDSFFAWGRDQTEIISPAVGDLVDRIEITGNPRFDLLSKQFRPFYKKRTDRLNDEFGRILLINTNFSFGNSSNSTEALQNTLSLYPIAQERPGFFEGWTNEQKYIMQSFVDFLPELRSRYPEHSIIIRPHPSEQLSTWEEISKKFDKVHAIREGSVVPWILASDVLIHWNCTTAIESFLLGVPAIAYRKNCSGEYVQPLPNVLSFHAYSEEEMFKQIDQAVNDQLMDSEKDLQKKYEHLNHYVASADGTLASEKIASKVLEIGQAIERSRPVSQRALQVAKKMRRSYLDLVIKDRKIRDEYSTSKFPPTGEEEIQEIVDDLRACLNFEQPVNAKKIWTNCFELKVQTN